MNIHVFVPLFVRMTDFLHCLSFFDVIGLRYDVLLLHADSDENATNTLGGILHKDLTESSEPPYNVFCYRRNVQFGEGMKRQRRE